MKIDREMQNLQ